MRIWIASALGLLEIWGVAAAEEPVPLGEEFQVNTYTTGLQFTPSVATDIQGNFIVVWVSHGSSGTDTDSSSIQAQRLRADGAPLGGQFQVNSYTTNLQMYPEVAADLLGNFVVVWQSFGSGGTDASTASIQAQRYGTAGTPLGGQFQVNTYTTGRQLEPAVAADPLGNLVVVWESFGSDGLDTDRSSVQAQRYGVDGAPLGGQFQVNTYTPGYEGYVAVAAQPLGDFVVVWESSSLYFDDWGNIHAQRYDVNGAPLGGQVQVNSYTSDWQLRPAVATDPQGKVVVVWSGWGSYGSDTYAGSIQGRRYDADGAPLGGQFQVNEYTTGHQNYPSVAADLEGNFIVVWQSEGSWDSDTDGYSIQAQAYDAEGEPLGGQFQVNSYTSDWQRRPTVATDPQGNFVVLWESDGSSGTDTSGRSILAQRFASPSSIFTDGFESGDTSAWSSTVE